MYLDYAATTPLKVEVKEAIYKYLNNYGNPSSLHAVGDAAKKVLIESERTIAQFIHAEADQIIFTSGGSASNCLAIEGWLAENEGVVHYSPIAHKSILECAKAQGDRAIPLVVDAQGKIDLSILDERLEQQNGLVVIDYANSEIGVIQDVNAIITICHKYNCPVFLDATGSIAQIPVNVKKLDVDMLAFSGHKLGSLKGCGVLYKKKDIKLKPLIYGSQNHGLFAGTENMIGIVALAAAVKNYDYSSITTFGCDYLWGAISSRIHDAHWIGGGLPHNLYVIFDGISGTHLSVLLDVRGYQVSAGSACSSGSKEISSTLRAIGQTNDGIRISLSGNESFGSLDDFINVLEECVKVLRGE